jgi:hypothetical protein
MMRDEVVRSTDCSTKRLLLRTTERSRHSL